MAYQPAIESKVTELDYSKANASTVGSLKSSLQAMSRKLAETPARDELAAIAQALDDLSARLD